MLISGSGGQSEGCGNYIQSFDSRGGGRGELGSGVARIATSDGAFLLIKKCVCHFQGQK